MFLSIGFATKRGLSLALAVMLWLALAGSALAQTTSFVYQGKLTDGGAAANGNYDFQFTLWDSLTGGAQIGSTQTVSNTVVSNGVFTIKLDFGAANFPGADRFLEISARPTGAGLFTLLTPRQQVTSTPYAVRSANASSANTLSVSCTGCITDTQIGSVAASKLTGTIPVSAVPAGSTSYVQNTTTQQTGTSFNISGNGTAGGTLSGGNLITNGNVGIATTSFLRPASLQFGADFNAAFTISPSSGTPNAGYVRFGDSTGWKLHFARSRESSLGALNTGTTGALLTIQDNGNVGIGNTAPTFRMHVVDTSNTGLRVQTNSKGGTVASFGGNGDFQIDAVNVPGGRLIVKENGNVGIGTTNLALASDHLSGSTTSRLTLAGAANACSGNQFCPGQDGLSAVGGSLASSNTFAHAGAGVLAIGGYASNGAYSGDGLFAKPGFADNATGSVNGSAGLFEGDVAIFGNLYVSGSKDFQIDHPLDPENKYLRHAAIESSEVLNVYSGNVVTDAKGDAVVTLPDWFETLNKDLRYQLTVIGQFAQAVVADEVKNNRFTIKTSAPRVKVSWQVTGVRSDAYMLTHPFKVEEEKPERERGSYLSPESFGKPEEKGAMWARRPELMRQIKEQREQARKEQAQQKQEREE